MRREVGGRLGCPVMYLTGACGDLVPKERVRFVVDPRRVEPEVMVGTTLELRRQHPELDLWTMGLTNADVGYLPTSRMVDEGGYEGRSTVFAATAGERVRSDVSILLRRIGVA